MSCGLQWRHISDQDFFTGILAREPRVLIVSTVAVIAPGAQLSLGRDHDPIDSSGMNMNSSCERQGIEDEIDKMQNDEAVKAVLMCALMRARGLLVLVADPSLVLSNSYLTEIFDLCARHGACDGALRGASRAIMHGKKSVWPSMLASASIPTTTQTWAEKADTVLESSSPMRARMGVLWPSIPDLSTSNPESQLKMLPLSQSTADANRQSSMPHTSSVDVVPGFQRALLPRGSSGKWKVKVIVLSM